MVSCTASEDFIIAEEDCELFYITLDELKYLYCTFVEFNVVGRVITTKCLRVFHWQARNIRMLKAKERYEFLLQTRPQLVNRVLLTDIALHIDIARGTLSRVRGEI